MKGTPPASLTEASDFTLFGIAGLFWMFAMNDEDTAAIITEPASAVPIDAPRLVIVFWTPPTSGLRSSGTADTVTAPSCDASAPTPSPIRSIGTKTISGPEVSSSVASRTQVPAPRASRPPRTTSRGDTFGHSLGMPIAASSSVSDSGSSRAPVASAERPRQTERYSGTTKNSPACIRYWKKNIARPPVNCLLRSRSGRSNGSCPCASRRASQRKNSQITNSPANINQSVGDMPPQDGPPGFGWNQPQTLERRIPKTSSASPSAESAAPIRSSFGRVSTGASAILRARTRMPSTRTTSPANTQRHEKYVVQKPPISGPTATATAPAAATMPYAAARRFTGKLPATRATIAGRIRAAPTPSRNDQPNSSTGRLCATDVVNDPAP